MPPQHQEARAVCIRGMLTRHAVRRYAITPAWGGSPVVDQLLIPRCPKGPTAFEEFLPSGLEWKSQDLYKQYCDNNTNKPHHAFQTLSLKYVSDTGVSRQDLVDIARPRMAGALCGRDAYGLGFSGGVKAWARASVLKKIADATFGCNVLSDGVLKYDDCKAVGQWHGANKHFINRWYAAKVNHVDAKCVAGDGGAVSMRPCSWIFERTLLPLPPVPAPPPSPAAPGRLHDYISWCNSIGAYNTDGCFAAMHRFCLARFGRDKLVTLEANDWPPAVGIFQELGPNSLFVVCMEAAKVANVDVQTLQSMHPACFNPPSNNLRSIYCVSAMHRLPDRIELGVSWSQEATLYGPPITGTALVATVAVNWYGNVGVTSKLRKYHPGCDSIYKSQDGDCMAAIHRFCTAEHGGSPGGIAVEVGSLAQDNFGVGCFDPRFLLFAGNVPF